MEPHAAQESARSGGLAGRAPALHFLEAAREMELVRP